MELAAIICLTILLIVRELVHAHERRFVSLEARDERRALMNRITHPEIYEMPRDVEMPEEAALPEESHEEAEQYARVGQIEDVTNGDG